MPRYANVCSIRVPVIGAKTYGGGHIYPGVRDLGTFARVSKKTAQKLIREQGIPRLPRMGYEVTLCKDVFLSNKSGFFEVERRASGGLRGNKGCPADIGKKKASKKLRRKR